MKQAMCTFDATNTQTIPKKARNLVKLHCYLCLMMVLCEALRCVEPCPIPLNSLQRPLHSPSLFPFSRVHLLRNPFPTPSLISLMNDLPPPNLRGRIFEKLNGRMVMLILLHRCHPRHIVKRNDFEPEVGVVRDLGCLAQEGGQVRRGDAVDVGYEIGGCEAVSVRGRASNLER
jgi:hypothetical protein